MGGFHGATLRSLPSVDEVRVWDVDPARRTVETIVEALDGAGAALIATPASTHGGLIVQCVERGVPVFCEKPIALDLEETQRVVDRVEAGGVAVQMGFQRRFDAAFSHARDRIVRAELGRIHSFALATFDRTPPPAHYVPTSGGLFKDMHIHDFDAVRWLFGQEVEEVSATGAVLIDSMFSDNDDIDTSGVTLRLGDGSLGVLSGARSNPGGYVARLDVYGSVAEHSVREDRPYRDFLDRYPDAYRAEVTFFIEMVATGRAPSPCTARDALAALRIAEAADRSRREGRSVRLSEIGSRVD